MAKAGFQQKCDPNNYGRLTKVIVDYNQTNGLNITSQYKYDARGNVIEANDPNNDKARFAYDKLNKLVKVISPSPYNNVARFTYDKCSMLVKLERGKWEGVLIDYGFLRPRSGRVLMIDYWGEGDCRAALAMTTPLRSQSYAGQEGKKAVNGFHFSVKLTIY